MKKLFFIVFLIQVFFAVPLQGQTKHSDEIHSFEELMDKDVYFHNMNLQPLAEKAIFVMLDGKLKPYTKYDRNALYKDNVFSCYKMGTIKNKKYLIFKNSSVDYYFLVDPKNQPLLDHIYSFTYWKNIFKNMGNEYKYYDITQDPDLVKLGIDKSLLKYNRYLRINWDKVDVDFNTEERGIFTYYVYGKVYKESYSELKDKINREIFIDDKKLQELALEEDKKYRENGKWNRMKFGTNMYCKVCHKDHTYSDLALLGIGNDSIYYLLPEPDKTLLGEELYLIHYSKIERSLKSNQNFERHFRIWKDSIDAHSDYTNRMADLVNDYYNLEFMEKIITKAPYGYISDWGWYLNVADGVEPHFSYTNIASKTIKYVDFYFSLKNAVGDRCYLKYERSYQGSVRGVGPVEPGETANWSWSRATHYTSSDASEMNIDKLVITYMDGSVKTIQGKDIVYK